MKLTIVMIAVASLLSACSGRHATSAQETDETKGFCRAVVAYVISQYDTVPRRIKQSTYRLDESNQNQLQLVDLQHISSDYDVILQHQGRQAVFDYCLARHQVPRLDSDVSK